MKVIALLAFLSALSWGFSAPGNAKATSPQESSEIDRPRVPPQEPFFGKEEYLQKRSMPALERTQKDEPPVPWDEVTVRLLEASDEQLLAFLDQQQLPQQRALALIWRRHPGLEAARESWKATFSQYAQLETLKDTLNVYGQYLSRPTGMGQSKAMIERQYPWPGVITLQNRIITTSVIEARLNYDIRIRDLWIDAKNTYHEAQFLHEKLRLLQEHVDLLSNLYETVSSLYINGKSSLSELLNVEIQRAQLEEEKITVERDIDVLRVKLNALMNLPPSIQWRWVDEPYDTQLKSDHQIEVPPVDEKQLELRILQARQARMEYLVALEEIVLSPSLSPDFAITATITPIERTRKQELKLPRPSAFFGQRDEYLQEIRFKRSASLNEVAAYKNQLNARIRKVVRHINKGLRGITLYRDVIVPKAERSFEFQIYKYTVGRNQLVSVLRAQELVLKFETKLFDSYRFLRIQENELRKLLGMPIINPSAK